MITKTIGAGGDYADIGLAMAYASGLGALYDDITFDIVSDLTENNGCNVSISFNSHELTIKNDNRFVVTAFNNQKIFSITSAQNAISGNRVVLDGIIYKVPLYNDNYRIFSVRPGYVDTYLTVTYKNITIIGNGSSGTNFSGISLYGVGRSEINILNCKFYNLGIGIHTDNYSYLSSDNKTIENCAAYGCRYGVNFGYSTSNGATIKNTVCVGSSIEDFGTISNATTTNITNCADSDNSIASSGAILTDNITGITTSDFISVDPTSVDFLKIDSDSALFETGTTDISTWNTSDPLGHIRPNNNTKVSIGFYEPFVPAKKTIRFFNGSNSIEINRPTYGCTVDVHMPILSAGLHPTGYLFNDLDDTMANDYRVFKARWQLSAASKAALNTFFRDVAGGRCENVTMSLGATDSGFYPGGADLGSVGDWTVRLLDWKQSGVQMSPFRYFEDELTFIIVSAPTRPALPSVSSQGVFNIGDVTTLCYPQNTFTPEARYNYKTSISRTGAPYSIDGNNSGDSWESSWTQQCNNYNAAALMAYLTGYTGGGRAKEVDIVTDLNYYGFGIDQGGNAHYIAHLLGSAKKNKEMVLSITHEGYNRFTIPLTFWMTKNIPTIDGGTITELDEDVELEETMELA